MGLRSALRELLPQPKPEPVVVEPFDGSRTVRIGEGTYTMHSDVRDEYLNGIADEFEPDLAKLFRAVVKPGGVAFDVGANLGFTAVLLGQIASRVTAYEISPITFSHLERNVAASGLGNIEIVAAGLGSVAGETELTVNPNHRAGSFIADHETADRRYHLGETVEVRTLDNEAQRLGLEALDFIKIDVEGFEMHVLRGGRATLERFRPVVVMEMNHWCLNAFQRTALPDFIDFVQSIFPVAYAIQGTEYLDLSDPDRRYAAMHKNIVDNSFMNVVAAFDAAQLDRFRTVFTPTDMR